MAREGSKRAIAIEIMNSNAKKPMAEVLELIAKANDIEIGAARSYYVYLVKNDMAKGKIEDKPKAVKAPKPVKAKEPKAVKPSKAPKAEKPTAPAKSADEIAAIKAANLTRMKSVLAKTKQVVAADPVAFAETDAFSAPESLTAEEVKALV